jgi:integrase
MTKTETAVAALRSAGVADDKIEATLRALGLAPRPSRRAGRLVKTAAQVAAAHPGVWRVSGATGLYLKKSGPDTGSYFFRYWFGGVRRGMGLGSISEITLAQARDKALELRLTRRTHDPIEVRRQEKADAVAKAEAEARQAATLTVEEAVKAYIADRASSWRHVYARSNWLNPIMTHALPLIGQLKVDAVEPRHILTVVKAMDDKGVATLGRKVRSRLKTVFDFLAAHGLRDAKLSNPADAGVINAGRPSSEGATEHFRRIDLDVAPGVFAQLMQRAPASAAIAAWAFMALTAARPGEALAARWDQIDFDKGLWLNPAPKTKKAKKGKNGTTTAETGKPLVVPLSPPALKILDMARAFGASDFLFKSRGGGKLAHSTFAPAPARAAIDAGAPHSWRSIFRDWAEDKGGFRRETAEAALGHSLGAVEKAYRRETGVETRRVMMDQYSQWLLGEGVGNVVAFKERA